MAFAVKGGPMDRLNKQNNESNYHLKRNLEEESALDATGYWFATAVLFAVLAAGVIVYRNGAYDIRTASNDTPTAAQSNPIAPAPNLPQR
jgi:hypothetical protein